MRNQRFLGWHYPHFFALVPVLRLLTKLSARLSPPEKPTTLIDEI